MTASTSDKLREALAMLQELVDARWMVSPDWCDWDEYDEIVDRARALLARDALAEPAVRRSIRDLSDEIDFDDGMDEPAGLRDGPTREDGQPEATADGNGFSRTPAGSSAWTTEVPTEPGWYWAIHEPGKYEKEWREVVWLSPGGEPYRVNKVGHAAPEDFMWGPRLDPPPPPEEPSR